MSRVLLVACLILAVSNLSWFHESNAQETDISSADPMAAMSESHAVGEYGAADMDGHSKFYSDHVASADEIEGTLDLPLKAPVKHKEQPFHEVMNALQEAYNLPIVIDLAALEEVAITPETKVTVDLRNISLRSALKMILKQPDLTDLTFIVDDEILLITTKEVADQQYKVVVYRVDDLILNYPQVPGGNEQSPYSSLVQMITRCVATDTWTANGSGEGEIQLIQPGLLVVSQTYGAHEQLRKLLFRLRDMINHIEQ